MSNLLRKVRRNQLKKQMGNNKINEFYHQQYDTIEERMRKAKVGGAIYGANTNRGKLF